MLECKSDINFNINSNIKLNKYIIALGFSKIKNMQFRAEISKGNLSYNELYEQYKNNEYDGLSKKYWDELLKYSEAYVENLNRIDVKILSFDFFYNQEYNNINPRLMPFIIHYIGNIELLKNNIEKIGIVGSRSPSAHSISFTQSIASEISNDIYSKSCVVSGMAKGIDYYAHMSAKRSIAVLGTGIDIIYPKSSKAAYNHILENNGIIISQFPTSTNPLPKNFVIRNKTISCISDKVVIMEASLKSGSLTTAKFAKDMGKKLFAVPGHPSDPRSNGCNLLIKNNAILFENYSSLNQQVQSSFDFLSDNKELFNAMQEIDCDVNMTVESLISNVPIDINKIAEILNSDISIINTEISRLEILGKAKIINGKSVIKL